MQHWGKGEGSRLCHSWRQVLLVPQESCKSWLTGPQVLPRSVVLFSDASPTAHLLITTSHLSPPTLIPVLTPSLLPCYQQPQGRTKTVKGKQKHSTIRNNWVEWMRDWDGMGSISSICPNLVFTLLLLLSLLFIVLHLMYVCTKLTKSQKHHFQSF